MDKTLEQKLRQTIRTIILSEDLKNTQSVEFLKIKTLLDEFVKNHNNSIGKIEVSGQKLDDMDMSISNEINGDFNIDLDGVISGTYNITGKEIEQGQKQSYTEPSIEPKTNYQYNIKITGLYVYYPINDAYNPNVELTDESLFTFLNKLPGELYKSLLLKIKELIKDKI